MRKEGKKKCFSHAYLVTRRGGEKKRIEYVELFFVWVENKRELKRTPPNYNLEERNLEMEVEYPQENQRSSEEEEELCHSTKKDKDSSGD